VLTAKPPNSGLFSEKKKKTKIYFPNFELAGGGGGRGEGIAAEKVQTFALVKSRDFLLGLVFRLTLHHLHDSGQVVIKRGAVQRRRMKASYMLCRWFRFAQLAKGKKFRP
jgi:hypothetical protein